MSPTKNVFTTRTKAKAECVEFHLHLLQGGPNLFLSSQTDKLMAGTKFSDHLGLKNYKKAKEIKHFIHLNLANWPQSLQWCSY